MQLENTHIYSLKFVEIYYLWTIFFLFDLIKKLVFCISVNQSINLQSRLRFLCSSNHPLAEGLAPKMTLSTALSCLPSSLPTRHLCKVSQLPQQQACSDEQKSAPRRCIYKAVGLFSAILQLAFYTSLVLKRKKSKKQLQCFSKAKYRMSSY